MRIPQMFRKASATLTSAFGGRYHESCGYSIRGDVFFTLTNTQTGEVTKVEHRNIVVQDASILIARLMKDSQEPTFGAYVLAVGTGDSGWDLQAPPAATATQRSLYAEITRKTYSDTQFVTTGGVPVAYPTNIVDFTTIFTEAEAVGPLVEMGLLGGNISTNMSTLNPVTPPNGTYDDTVDLTAYETMINYLTFPVINKPATSTLQIVWRLTF